LRVLTAAPREERKLLGILLILAGVVCLTLVDSAAKWLVQSMPPMEVVFVRYLGHLAIVLLITLPVHGLSLFRTNAPRQEIWRGLTLLGATLFNFTAVKYLPLATTATIAFTAPLWIAALSGPLLGEKVGLRRWAAVGVGFLGVLVVVQPGLAGFHWATLLALGTALCAALYMISTRQLAGVDATATQQLYAAGIAALVIAPLALLDWHWPATSLDWFAFVMIGFWGWLGHQVITIAHRYADASLLAPYFYLELIPMTLAGYLIFHDRPDIWVFVGAGIVVASGLYVWYRERQLAARGIL
jgi:drug/metabolite transporter (DMT)-like permease